MIERLPFVLVLSDTEKSILNVKKPWNGKQWTDEDFVNNIKPKIKKDLVDNQNCCAYCGLPFKSSKDMQIEHIAPKANFRYPEFTFELKNLVLSCGYCNDLIVKGSKVTIKEPRSNTYERCEFLLIHPYFDDPDDHIQWIEDDENDQVLIQVRNDSTKGIFSIDMFELDSIGMSELRACASFRRRRHNNSESDLKKISQVLDFKPN
jgi:uncharacterized protein (TIGR02646 family)